MRQQESLARVISDPPGGASTSPHDTHPLTSPLTSFTGKRYTVRASPMAPLSAVVEEALRQAGVVGVAPAACALELKGKALDQRLPLRFANLPATAKLELKTGQEPVLGVRAAPAAPSAAPAAAAPRPPAPPAQAPPQPSAPPATMPAAASAPAAAPPPAAPAPLPAPPPARPAAPAAAPPAAPAPPPAPSAPASAPEAPPSAAAALLGREAAIFSRADEMAADAAAAAPAAAAAGAEDDDSVFEVTEADLRAVMAGYARAARAREAPRGLATRAMREAEAAARAAAAGAVAVRAELPGGLVLQAAFPAAAPLAELRALVARALAPAAAAGGFHLFTTPPKAVLHDMSASFYSAGFVPAARVHVGLNDAAVAAAAAAGGGAVRPEVLALLGPPPPRGEVLRARGAGAGSGGAGGQGASGSGAEPVARPAGDGAPRRAAGGGGSKPKWLKL